MQLTKEQIEQNVAAYRHACETGKIEGIEWENCFSEWKEKSDWLFGFSTLYRLKPKPKLRAWKLEEVPIGALVKGLDENDNSWRSMIVAVDNGYIFLGGYTSTHSRNATFEGALEKWTHSIDHGKTWHPCGVME